MECFVRTGEFVHCNWNNFHEVFLHDLRVNCTFKLKLQPQQMWGAQQQMFAMNGGQPQAALQVRLPYPRNTVTLFSATAVPSSGSGAVPWWSAACGTSSDSTASCSCTACCCCRACHQPCHGTGGLLCTVGRVLQVNERDGIGFIEKKC